MADPWSEWQPCFDIGGGVAGCCTVSWTGGQQPLLENVDFAFQHNTQWVCLPAAGPALAFPWWVSGNKHYICVRVCVYVRVCYGNYAFIGNHHNCVYICVYLLRNYWCYEVCVEVLPLLGLWLLRCVPFRLACVYLYNSESDYWVLLIITTNEHNLDNLEKCQIVQENLNHSPDTSRGADWLHEQ